MNNLVPLLVAIPMGMGFLIPLARRWHERLSDVLSCIALLITVCISFALVGREMTCHMGGWPTPIGIDLKVDPLAVLLLLITNGLALLVGVYSAGPGALPASRYQYYSLFMFLVAGTNGVAISGDLFNLYVFIEITAIASYALVAFDGQDESLEASFKYAVLGGLSSSAILIGIILLYSVTGTLNLNQLTTRFDGGIGGAPARFAIGLFFCGFGLKSGLIPFHTWLPDAYPAAPAPISAILSGVVSKVAGVYVLTRLLFNVVGVNEEMLMMMRWMGGLTMVVGGLLALGQWDIKRLFAYSSISQVGLIVLAFGFGTMWGVVGALFHLLNHAAFKSLLFLGSGQVERVAGTRDMREMHDLRERIPLTATTSLVASLSLAGIPPFNGFWSKLIIVVAGLQSGHGVWSITIVLMSIVALAYQLKMQKATFSPGKETQIDLFSSAESKPFWGEESPFAAVPMVLLAIGCFGLSMLVWPGLDQPYLIGPAAEVLMQGVVPP